jgi:hypothetical protein
MGVVVSRLVSVVVFVVFAFAAISPTRADESFGSFVVVDGINDTIFLNGPITANTPLDFRRAMQLRPEATVVMLSSEGGQVQSALLVAQDLHDRGLDTYVATDKHCNSACSFVFLAGRMRTIDGSLGVHQMAADIEDNAGIQSSMAYVMEVLGVFEPPPQVISRMLRTPPEDLYVFQASEWRQIDKSRIESALQQPVREKPGLVAVNEGEAVSTPALQQPMMMVVPVQRLAIYEGLDFFGADLASGHAENFVECSRACLGDRQCKAFTYNKDPKIKSGPNCFLKGGYDRLEAFEQALSGLRLGPNETGAPRFEIGAIDPLVDLTNGERLTGAGFGMSVKASNLGGCRTACVVDTTCQAFTYRTSNKQCTLQTSVGDRIGATGYYSGTKRMVTFIAAEIIPIE